MRNFENYSIKDFNLVMDTDINNTMSFADFVDEIEEGEVSYFYVSSDENDVLEAIDNEEEIAEMLDLRLIFVEELGIYIATY